MKFKVGDKALLVKLDRFHQKRDFPILSAFMRRAHKINRVYLNPREKLQYVEIQTWVTNRFGKRIWHSFWIAASDMRKVKG